MAAVTRLDTHVVVWLYAGEIQRLSPRAVRAVEQDTLVVSPFVQLELTYLHEIGRLTVGGPAIVSDLTARLGLTMSDVPLAVVIAEADALGWTRDPFDRLIVADALAAGSPLLTRDETIRHHTELAVW